MRPSGSGDHRTAAVPAFPHGDRGAQHECVCIESDVLHLHFKNVRPLRALVRGDEHDIRLPRRDMRDVLVEITVVTGQETEADSVRLHDLRRKIAEGVGVVHHLHRGFRNRQVLLVIIPRDIAAGIEHPGRVAETPADFGDIVDCDDRPAAARGVDCRADQPVRMVFRVRNALSFRKHRRRIRILRQQNQIAAFITPAKRIDEIFDGCIRPVGSIRVFRLDRTEFHVHILSLE